MISHDNITLGGTRVLKSKVSKTATFGENSALVKSLLQPVFW